LYIIGANNSFVVQFEHCMNFKRKCWLPSRKRRATHLVICCPHPPLDDIYTLGVTSAILKHFFHFISFNTHVGFRAELWIQKLVCFTEHQVGLVHVIEQRLMLSFRFKCDYSYLWQKPKALLQQAGLCLLRGFPSHWALRVQSTHSFNS
jgi:hypothetical protein